MAGNKTMIVHEGEETHDELTVHAIGDAAMTGDGFAEILDVERSFQTGREEATKGGDERGESGEDEDVELHGRQGDLLEIR